jgi:hypothetical protein
MTASPDGSSLPGQRVDAIIQHTTKVPLSGPFTERKSPVSDAKQRFLPSEVALERRRPRTTETFQSKLPAKQKEARTRPD